MHLKRTATFSVVGAALAAWLAGAATSGSRQESEPPRRATAPDPDVAALSGEVSRLHARLTPDAVPVQPGRDLFRFVAPTPKPAPVPRPAALTEAPVAVAPAAPPRPPIKLDGIAEDAQSGGVVRTAIIAAAGQLFLVREGDAVTPRFKVTRIGADAVELVDLLDNRTLTLPLR